LERPTGTQLDAIAEVAMSRKFRLLRMAIPLALAGGRDWIEDARGRTIL
jgi:hypothetical protein